ncbi:ABC transporter permease subunit [Planococcus lenghuensis]|uniref:ABC transporter permease subunit n=1 Tax=Planococcus lenghuensis TaxID=2213202 RepID=UPI001E2D3770|nr:ABC transporter permease subunit [Planococcus lenghuensis]
MKFLLKFLFSLIVILLASGLPVLVGGFAAGELRLEIYFRTIRDVLESLWPVQDIAIMNFRAQQEMPLFPDIFAYISYSLQILTLAIIAAVVTALVFTVLTMMLPDRWREQVKLALYFLESIPDLLVIMLAQLAVIAFFKKTGILVSSIAVLGDDRIYWLPVLCLMILPMIQLYRLSMLTFQEEERQLYVEFARSLGYSKAITVLLHMFRNAMTSVFFQSKKTVWFMLSNLFVLELMFNLPGIILFWQENMTPEVFLVTVLSFFLPVFILYSIGEWYFLRRLYGREIV